jgi:hypothetical protein
MTSNVQTKNESGSTNAVNQALLKAICGGPFSFAYGSERFCGRAERVVRERVYKSLTER